MKILRLALALTLLAAVAVESRGATAPSFAVTINSITILPNPAVVNTNVQITIDATGSVGALSYRVDFGDGTPLSFFTANPVFNHTYTLAKHYTLTIEFNEAGVFTSVTRPLTVRFPIPATKPTNSSTIIHDATNNRIWVVNPDQDTVATMTTGGLVVTEVKVGKAPRTLAQAADGTIWVVSQQHPSISIIQPVSPFALLHVIPLPHGSLPYGICMTADGSAAYVSFQGSGGVAKYGTASRSLLASASSPPTARGIAVTSDGRVLVTRFISPSPNPLLTFNDIPFTAAARGEVVELDSNLSVVRTFNLALDPGIAGPDPDFGFNPPAGLNSNNSRGQPNYLTSLVVTPDGRRAWVPSKKDNIQRGSRTPERDGRTPGPEVTYRAIVSSLDLVFNTAPTAERRDLDNSEMPQAACTSANGDYLFVALQGNNKIEAWDLYNMTNPLNGFGNQTGTTPTSNDGLSPQGLVLVGNTLYVQNYMGRSVAVIDASNILNSNGAPAVLPAPSNVVSTVLTADLLAANVLLGKRIFYNAGDPRMSLNGYISCAGCHLDGGADMRVFDFTNRTEGFRNTVMLQGRGNGTGMKHGNVHWSANFNEIQDFENDMVNAFGGTGYSGGAPFPPMGTANTGRTANLDALASYVHSLTKVSRSPFRNADGTLTAAGAAGEAVFKTQNCQQCHGGSEFTDSTIFLLPVPPGNVGPGVHNVGTQKPTSGTRLAQTLQGIDTPTLKGVWQTAPYFHDGSALTLTDVINAVPNTTANAHGGMHLLSAADRANLERYMLEIDEIDAPPVPTGQVNTVSITSVSSNRPYSLGNAAIDALPFVDRSYQISALSANLNNKILLRTAEDDKKLTATSHVVLSFANPGLTWRVYVCYDGDPRVTARPDWLSPANGWTVSGEAITLKNPTLAMTVLEQDVLAPGTLTLGGNKATGAVGALRNYFVIIRTLTGTQTFEQGPLSQGEWVHQDDADGDGVRDEFEAVTATTIANLSPWSPNSASATLSDEDQVLGVGGLTLFEAQPAISTGGGPIGGGGGGGGGCGLGGLEFLIPLLGLRALRFRRRLTA